MNDFPVVYGDCDNVLYIVEDVRSLLGVHKLSERLVLDSIYVSTV